jgi:hypothetical protein
MCLSSRLVCNERSNMAEALEAQKVRRPLRQSPAMVRAAQRSFICQRRKIMPPLRALIGTKQHAPKRKLRVPVHAEDARYSI